MLVLSTLHSLLSQVLSLPYLHTAVLLTPNGQLVSVASDPRRPKDEVRIVVGLAMEVWQETREQDFGMIDSELGRIFVLPIEDTSFMRSPSPGSTDSEDREPLMLLALNSTPGVEWDELETKGRVLVGHLAKPLNRFRDVLVVPKPVIPVSAATTSPPPRP